MDALQKHGLVVFGDAADADKARKALYVEKGKDMPFQMVPIESEALSESLKTLFAKEGTQLEGKKLYLPDFIVQRFEEITKLPETQGVVTKVISDIAGSLVNLQRTASTIIIPAFHATNLLGAAEMSMVAGGLKAADPALQLGAAAASVSAALMKDPSASQRMFRTATGDITLGQVIKAAEDAGVIGFGNIRYATAPETFSAAAKIVNAPINKFAQATGAQAVGEIVDNYQHLAPFMMKLKEVGHSAEGIKKAAMFAKEMSGNYALMSKAGMKIKPLGTFYSWAHFVVPWTIKRAADSRHRLAMFGRVKNYMDQKGAMETPKGAIAQEALPKFLQANAGSFITPKEGQLQKFEGGPEEFMMSTYESPINTMNALTGDFLGFARGQSNFAVKGLMGIFMGGIDPETGKSMGLKGDWLESIFGAPIKRPTRAVQALVKFYIDKGDMDAAQRVVLENFISNTMSFTTPLLNAVSEIGGYTGLTSGRQAPVRTFRKDYRVSPDTRGIQAAQEEYPDVFRAHTAGAKQ